MTLAFDVRDEKAVSDAIDNLPAEWKNIDILFNNAGLALGRDYFEEADLDDWNVMIDTNVKGFMYVAKAVSRLMAARKQGHIINCTYNDGACPEKLHGRAKIIFFASVLI
jgi:NADP-dependent 3-hydroxy acid dehydrogenase YdfG